MRTTHDPYDFAAPSPIVPTSRTRQSIKAKPFYNMSASTARHISSIANRDTDSKPLRLLGIISDGQQQQQQQQQYPDTPHKAEDVADLIRCLQSPSAATVTSTASATGTASASASSLLTTTSGSGPREMLKAGHRRLRQLAQRPRKDTDSASKIDEEARQLSALHREGLLPSPAASSSSAAASPAASSSTLRRSPAKRKSAESSPVHPTHPTPQQNSSRRDVERIGQPWLADPLERCMLDTLSSSGRLSSLDLGDLAAFMDTALDEPESKTESTAESQLQPQSQPQPQPQPAQPEPKPQSTQLDTKDSDKTEDKQKEEKEDKADREKRPHLKLFPDPLPPPRISSTAARRLSKCPPAQPAGLPPVTEMSSPPKPDRQQSVPSDRKQSTSSDKDPALSDKESTLTEKEPTPAEKPSAPAETYQLPIHAIKAMFPLPAPTRPAPTRPLPAVPEIAVNMKKNGHSSPSSGSRASQSPILHQSSEPRRQSPPQTSQLQVTTNPESERGPRPFSFEAPVVESSDKQKNIDFNHTHTHTHNKDRPQSPSAVSSPPTLASTRPLNWQTKRPSPAMAPETQPGSEVRRNNSACSRVRQLEHPLPSSDEEGRQEGMRKQKRTNPSPQKKHHHHHRSKLSSAKPAPLSPTRSPPSQHDIHPADAHLHSHSHSHSHAFANVHVQALQARVAHLERQNKVLQAALLAALDAGNKDPSVSASDGLLLSAASPGPAPAPASTPVSRITPPSSLTTSASSMDEPEHEPRDDRRDTWLDLDTRSRSNSGSSNSTLSFDFGATERALEGIHDVDFGWLSDQSSFVH